jgi:outer membrane protein assembly factor BamB
VTLEEAKRRGWKEEGFTEKEENKGKITVPYPKLVFMSNASRSGYPLLTEIRFYNRNGKLLKKKTIKQQSERVIYSENGKYILISRVPGEFTPEHQGGTLYKSDGTVVWEKDEGFFVVVNDEGYVIATYPTFEAEPSIGHIFYDPSGTEISRIENPMKDKAVGYDAVKFSSEGNYAVIGYSDTYNKTVIILTTKEGKILWKREFDYVTWAPREADIVENLGIVGLFGIGKRQAYFVDWQGDSKWTVPLEARGNMRVRIEGEKKRIIICSTKGYIWSIDIKTGKFTWRHKEEWAPDPPAKMPIHDVPQFVDMKLIENNVYVRGAYKDSRRRWYGSALYVFDAENGRLKTKIDSPEQKLLIRNYKDKFFIIDVYQGKLIHSSFMGGE